MTQHPFKPLLVDLLQQAQLNQNAFFQSLAPEELATTGTPELWAAKDHMSHMTYWRRRLVERLRTILHQQELPQSSEHYLETNERIFEANRHRSWQEILAESDEVYKELFAITEQISEEDLTTPKRFSWTTEGTPLYTSYMGNCYEHTQQHLAQYLLDRQDLEGATHICEAWANRVIGIDAPDTLKGFVMYNLACFYATHGRVEQARKILPEALTLAPELKEFARTDSDLTELHSELPA